MENAIRKHYYGIDLGTTNSVVSWSTQNHKGEIVTEVLNIDMMDISGKVKTQILPSYIFYDEKGTPIIGKKSKHMLTRQPDRVIKNSKSYMGMDKTYNIGGKEITPVESATAILKYLGKQIENQFGEYPEDVIITVPASFDSDKRLATLKAAENAGFRIKNEKGEKLEILLSEPRAALYDYVNLQNSNKIINPIDFRNSKNVVVFDLGGGTLDVSLHSLIYNDKGDIDISDLAVSRYTEIGGSNFDEIIGDQLFKSFIKKNRIKNIDAFDENFLKNTFIEFAEEMKFDLNEQVDNIKNFGDIEDIKNLDSEIYKTNFYQGYSFNEKISLKEYKKYVDRLLGTNLSIKDLDRIDEIYETENIIYPILDVLRKAKDKLGEIPKIDFVILNGGMTKFHVIDERIEQFFSMKPSSVLDQDKAVARGAAVYNYRINNGEKFEKIQNDTIGLERFGGEVVHLIEAGTVLPIKKVIDSFEIPANNIRRISLPFYLGRRTDTKAPNRKIAEHCVNFEKLLKAGEKVKLEIEVDEMGIMNINGIVGNDKESFNIVVNSEIDFIEDNNLLVNKTISNQKQKIFEKFVPDGDFIDISHVLREFKAYGDKYHNLKIQSQKSVMMNRIKAIEVSVLNAVNGKHFLEALLKEYATLKNETKTRATYLLGEFGKRYLGYRREIEKEFMKNLDINELMLSFSNKNSSKEYIRFSIEGLRKIEARIENEEELLQLLNAVPLAAYKSSLIMTVGAIFKSQEALYKLINVVKNEGTDASYWALGKFGSRERKIVIPIEMLQNEILKISKKISSINKVEVLRSAIYSIAEICDRRFEGDKISKEAADEILNELKKVINRSSPITKILEVAKSLIKGDILTEDQERVLLDMRVKI